LSAEAGIGSPGPITVVAALVKTIGSSGTAAAPAEASKPLS
jgi:hypothetical protein